MISILEPHKSVTLQSHTGQIKIGWYAEAEESKGRKVERSNGRKVEWSRLTLVAHSYIKITEFICLLSSCFHSYGSSSRQVEFREREARWMARTQGSPLPLSLSFSLSPSRWGGNILLVYAAREEINRRFNALHTRKPLIMNSVLCIVKNDEESC